MMRRSDSGPGARRSKWPRSPLSRRRDLVLLRNRIEVASQGDNHPAKAALGQGFQGEEEVVAIFGGDAFVGNEFFELVDDDEKFCSWLLVFGARFECGFENGLDGGGRGFDKGFGDAGFAEAGGDEFRDGTRTARIRAGSGLPSAWDGRTTTLRRSRMVASS